jgi:peptide-methionine (S)-S-oxide reductase
MTRPIRFAWALSLVCATTACQSAQAASDVIPAPLVDAPLATTPGRQTAVVAGGCFWGVEAVFRHVRGVSQAVSGYAGGTAATATYDMVSTGRTTHAEAVEITYDPSQITYGTLLRIFFSIAHDPTELNRQGPDEGPQYRSAIFADAGQQRIAEAYIAQLNQARVFPKRIATQVTALARFFAAEDYHQDYVARHPNDPYVVINDAPKVRHLRAAFPELYVGK